MADTNSEAICLPTGNVCPWVRKLKRREIIFRAFVTAQNISAYPYKKNRSLVKKVLYKIPHCKKML